MARFTLPRDLYHGKGALEALKDFEGKRAMICVGGGSMKRFGFLDRAKQYLEEAGMEVCLFEGIEPDPSVETVMKGAKAMEEFKPDWIVAMGGGSPIDAAKAISVEGAFPVAGQGFETYVFVRDAIDVDKEIAKLEEEISKAKALLEGSEKKLSNEKFVSFAKPEAIEKERAKKREFEEKIEKTEREESGSDL